MRALVALGCVALFALAACSADRPRNPSFPLELDAARAAWRRLDAQPRTPVRPVVVIGGIFDSPARVQRLAARLRQLTADDALVVAVSVRDTASFDEAVAVLRATLADALPGAAHGDAPQVDVVGVSMGGLVARYAALSADPPLVVRRLFTLASPHRGARTAVLPVPQPRVRDMRAGSAFLRTLDAGLPAQTAAGMQLVAYVRLGDAVVGASAAAPPGQTPFWLANQPWQLAHSQVDGDERILVDIARRLRGEAAFATPPAAALPSASGGALRRNAWRGAGR